MLIFVLPKKSKNRLGVGTGAEGLRHPSHQKQCQFIEGFMEKSTKSFSTLMCFFRQVCLNMQSVPPIPLLYHGPIFSAKATKTHLL